MRWLIRAALSLLALILITLMLLGGFSYAYRGDYPVAPRIARPTTFKPHVASSAKAPGDGIVVMLVLDGLAPSLVQAVDTPNLDRVARQGVHTLSMEPVFPTLSMPNHMSLSTGCQPQRHGIVSNRFIDPKHGLYADYGDVLWTEECEHLTVVAERQGVRAHSYGWMGAHRREQLLVSGGGPLEDLWPTIEERVAQLISAYEKSTGSSLIIGYVPEPDQTLHFKGLSSPESLIVMQRVDAALGRVLDAIERSPLRDRTSLVVTTDHGMIPVGTHINLEAVLRREQIEATFVADATIAHLYLNEPSARSAVMQKLAGYAQLEVMDPKAPPSYMRIGDGPRVGDVVVTTKPPYYMFDRGIWPSHLRFGAVISGVELADKRLAGMHGYPPATPGVQAVFFACGAGFAKGVTLQGLRSIDVHPTIATLLGITPGAPLDGAVHAAALAQ